MKKVLAVFGLLFGMAALSHAGTPQENGSVPNQSGPISATSIIASSASAAGGTFSLTVATPTVFNSGGGSYNGRICITKFVIQISSSSTVLIEDNGKTDWTLYGADLGVSQGQTLQLTDDHLGPFCIASGDQLTVAASGGTAGAESINVEGYTTYGGINNAGGPMY